MAHRVTIDPGDTVDVGLDWADWLDGDTLSGSSWAVAPEGGLAAVAGRGGLAGTHDDDSTTVWVGGGQPDTVYLLANRVETAGGRVAERTVQVWVEHL